MNDDINCTCGHAADEHGGSKTFPASTACNVDGCDCCAYEPDEDES
jgi:hypothetical protein